MNYLNRSTGSSETKAVANDFQQKRKKEAQAEVDSWINSTIEKNGNKNFS